jgi:hypothetical protein
MRAVLSIAEEIERLAGQATPGREAAVRNECWRQITRRMQRADTRRQPAERRPRLRLAGRG